MEQSDWSSDVTKISPVGEPQSREQSDCSNDVTECSPIGWSPPAKQSDWFNDLRHYECVIVTTTKGGGGGNVNFSIQFFSIYLPKNFILYKYNLICILIESEIKNILSLMVHNL